MLIVSFFDAFVFLCCFVVTFWSPPLLRRGNPDSFRGIFQERLRRWDDKKRLIQKPARPAHSWSAPGVVCAVWLLEEGRARVLFQPLRRNWANFD
jgi:hypothetical protein